MSGEHDWILFLEELCKYRRSTALEDHHHNFLQLLVESARALGVVLAILARLAARAVSAARHQGQRLFEQFLRCSSLADEFGPHGQQLF